MKRKIALFSIYILEIVFGVCYYVKDIWNAIIKAVPFMSNVGNLIGQIIRYFKGLINIQAFKDLPVMAQSIIVVLILTILFTIVFSLVFGIIATIQKKLRRNELSTKAQKVFTLSSEERAKFEWKLYIKKFPIRRLVSLIVPLSLFLLFLIIRFDKAFCEAEFSKIDGFFNIYGSIKPYLSSFVDGIEYMVSMYIAFNNRIYEYLGVNWVEWILLAISLVVICLLWWGLFSIFAKPFSHFVAKRKAQKAKNNYIEKMEIIEYKTWKKAQREMRVSNKAKEFYSQDEFNDTEDVDSNLIGQSTTNNDADNDNKKLKENSTQKEIDYLDDISTGVVDLGIVHEDNDEVKAPILSRETHFVGDEEIDIVLEKEPIIETIEEEEIYFDNQEYQDTFERYQPDNLVNIELDDKIKKYNIDLIDEEQVVLFDEEHPIINEYQDTNRGVLLNDDVKTENENTNSDNQKFRPIVKDSTRKNIKPINLSVDRKKVVEYIINNNKVKSNDNLINREVNVNGDYNDDAVDTKNSKVLKPIIKKEQNKKPIKPIAPMKVGRK